MYNRLVIFELFVACNSSKKGSIAFVRISLSLEFICLYDFYKHEIHMIFNGHLLFFLYNYLNCKLEHYIHVV